MEAYVFPNEEALSTAILARLVPEAAAAEPVLAGYRADGGVEVLPRSPLEVMIHKTLLEAGATRAAPSVQLQAVSCWAAAVRPRAAPLPDGAIPLALFHVDGPQKLLPLAADLLRLGCDRQELSLAPDGAFLRARTPPFYVVDGAREGAKGVRVYVPSPPSQDGVWIELGHQHPLTGRVAPPAEGLLLIRGDGAWTLVRPGAWRPLESILDPVLAPPTALPDSGKLPRLEVQLRLEPTTRSEPASFWVLKENARLAVEAMVRSVPAPQVDALSFAVAGELVALRARPGRESQVPDVAGQAYARVAQLPNLLVPHGTHLAPPLPRELLRSWLAADTEVVTWLEPGPNGLARMQLREAAFRPLSEWVDYVVDTSAEVLEAWVRSARFELTQFVADKPEPGPAAPDKVMVPPTPPAEARVRRQARPTEGPTQPVRLIQPPPLPPAPRPSPAEPFALPPPRTADEAEARAAQLEAEFLSAEHAPGSPARRAAWVSLARAYAAAGRATDAGLCWAHALWEETDPADAAKLAREWAVSAGSHAEALLAVPAPTADQTRALAAHVLASALEKVAPPAAPQRLVAWFDQHEENLDVRTLWLARAALSRLCGGDALMLARARDQVLQRLQRGLSLSRDVPQFLRVGGPGGGADVERTQQVTHQLESLLRAFDETQRKKKPAEAPWKLTRAYVQFEFAWGLARMGASERARALAETAAASLPRDPVHDYLSLAYRARIQQALEGKPPETPLPREVTVAYQAINKNASDQERLNKFIADRLRIASAILEPVARTDAMTVFWRHDKGHVGDHAMAIRSEVDANARIKAMEERATYVADTKNSPEERARILASMLDALSSLPASAAVPLLQRLVQLHDRLPPEHRAAALEAAMRAAGHFGQEGLVRQLVSTFGALLRELPPKSLIELGPAVASSVRSLRRLGLRDQAREVLSRAAGLLKGADTSSLVARLSLAGGFASLGDTAAAAPILEAALTVLSNEAGFKSPAERSKVSRATAQALGESPPQVALPGLVRLASQLSFTSDTNQTSSHFCISLVDLADTLVVGHVGDALVLHASTRRFLEEDEDRVRRRVHREVATGLT